MDLCLAQKFAPYLKATGKTSILQTFQTKPVNFTKINGLKFSPNLTSNFVQFNNIASKENISGEVRGKTFTLKNTAESPLKTIVVKKSKNEPSIYSLYYSNDSAIFDFDNALFKQCCNPVTLAKKNLPKQKIMHISNFHYPYGSISVTTPLNECITTDKLYQCAGVSIVDKKNKTQTLVHCYYRQSQKEVVDLLRHSLENKNPDDLKITLICGTEYETPATVLGLKNAIMELSPNLSIRYANFPKNVGFSKRAVMLHNGEISACTSDDITKANKIINPKSYMSYVEMNQNKNKLKCMIKDFFRDNFGKKDY